MKIIYILDNFNESSGVVVNSKKLVKKAEIEGLDILIFNELVDSFNSDDIINTFKEIAHEGDIIHFISLPITGKIMKIIASYIYTSKRYKNIIVSFRGDIRQLKFAVSYNNEELKKLINLDNTVLTGVTEKQMMEMIRFYSIKKNRKYFLISPGIDDRDIINIEFKDTRKYDFMFIGKATRAKGVDQLLNVINYSPYIRNVCIVTSGRRKEYFYYKKKLNNKLANVDWFHEIDNEEVLKLLVQSKIIFHPTRAESWGNVLVEAMLVKTFVMARDVGGIPEMLKGGELGILLKEDKKEYYLKMVEYYLKHQELTIPYIEKAYYYARKNYTISSQWNKLKNIYNLMLKENV